MIENVYLFADPFETQNRYGSLTPLERQQMHDTLEQLKKCRGRGCTIQRWNEQFDAHIQQRGFKRRYDTLGEKHSVPLIVKFEKIYSLFFCVHP